MQWILSQKKKEQKNCQNCLLSRLLSLSLVQLSNFTSGPDWTTCRPSAVQTTNAPPLPLLLHPPPAVQFHAFSTSFVPVESRRLSRLTGCRGWELVLPLQPSRPAAPALIGNSPRLPSGLLSSVLTCKTARLSRLSGPAGQLLAAISGLCYMLQNYLVVSVCHTVIFDSFQAAENLSASISVRWAGGGGSCSQGLAGQGLPTRTEMDIIHVLHHVASSPFSPFSFTDVLYFPPVFCCYCDPSGISERPVRQPADIYVEIFMTCAFMSGSKLSPFIP